MKKFISTIVAVGLLSSVLVNPASAGSRHGSGLNPLWIPVAIISTLAAVATIAEQPVYERRVNYDPHTTVIYEEPRRYRHERYYERDRFYEAPRYSDYR